MESLTDIKIHIKPLPVVEEIILHKANLTKDLINALVKYCTIYKAKNYLHVDSACREALTKYIRIKDGKKYPYAIDSKELLDRFEFFRDQTAKALDILPEIAKLSVIKRFTEERKPDPVEFLYYTYLLMPNLNPNKFAENMNNIKNSVHVLLDRITGTRYSALQSMLYLYSTEGGVGKSAFQNIMREWAKRRGIKLAYSRVPHNQFVGDEFNKNAICIFSDITKNECSNWNVMNDLIDGGNYVVEQKGKDRYELKAQAFLIGSSNFFPRESNSRRLNHSYVYYGETKLDPISEHTAFVLKNDSIDIDYYVDIVDKWILSCPSNSFDYAQYHSGIRSSAGDWYNGIDDNYAFILRAIAYYYNKGTSLQQAEYENYAVSVTTLTNRLNALIEAGDIPNLQRHETLSRAQVNNILTRLYKAGKIFLAGDAKGTYEKKYAIKPLIDDRVLIMQEETINSYTLFKRIKYDYIKERIVVLDVMRKIYNSKPTRIRIEVLNFLNEGERDIQRLKQEKYLISKEEYEAFPELKQNFVLASGGFSFEKEKPKEKANG